MTRRVRAVEVTRPPTTTVARGRWTSLPAPVEKRRGKSPNAVVAAVGQSGAATRRVES